MTAEETKIQQQQQKETSIQYQSPTTTQIAAAPIELTENFYINNKRKSNVKIQVKLSGIGIYLRRETEQQNNINEQLIRIEDIIGSRCGPRLKKRQRGGLSSCKRNLNQEHENDEEEVNSSNSSGGVTTGQQQQKDTSAYLYIYAYIKSEKINSPRNRTVRILRFRTQERFEDNLKSAERWYKAIKINKKFACGIMDVAGTSIIEQQQKPLLILLNPKSGMGKGRELFQKQVAPILKEAEAHYDLQITMHANYARDFVKCRKDLAQSYSGIIVASGDGLFYEVLNGLMERNDWRTVCRKLPIGIIPCGSGNGLAASIAHLYNEPYESKPIMHAVLTCVSGKSTPMDIVRVELCKSNNNGNGNGNGNGNNVGINKPIEMYSFLSIGWGLIADIDIESERLRSLGAQRFTLWTIRRLISLRTYKGKLSYLPWKEENQNQQQQQRNQVHLQNQTENVQNSQENEFHDVNNDDDNNFPEINDNEFFADAISLEGGSSNFRPHLDSWHSATSRRTAYYSIAGQSIRSRQSVLSKLEIINSEYEQRLPGPPQSTIPHLNMPLPDDWICDDGEFIMVHAAYTTHLATDCLFAPESRLNDGIIYLVIIKAGCGRTQLLQFLLGMSSGTHIPTTPNEFIKVIPVKAFRIEPYDSDIGDGIMAVDGERVDYGPIQAEIFPGMINVMVPNVGNK